jgi:hypothetical protein
MTVNHGTGPQERRTQNWYDERMENVIAQLLRGGVLAAGLVVIGGAVPYLGFHPRAHVDYRTFHGEPAQLKTVHGIVSAAFSGDNHATGAAFTDCHPHSPGSIFRLRVCG